MLKRSFSRLMLLFLAAAALLCAGLPRAAAADGPPAPTLDLSEEELAFVQQGKTLRVGFVQDRIPVSFSDKNGDLAGISRYIFDRVQQISGLRFEYVPLPAGSITYDYLTGQDLDLVTSVEYNEENKRANGILISEPYLSSRKVVVASKDLELDFNANHIVAISTGSQTLRKVLGASFPNFTLVDYSSITDCFDAVRDGKADLLIQNQYVVEYWIGKPAYEGLKVIPVLGMDDQQCFSAVVALDGGAGNSPEEGRLLIDILDKAIASMSEDEIGTYTIQAIMDNQYSLTIGDFLYRYRHMAAVVITAVLIIVTLAVLLLRQRVRSMEDRANAKARGQFLSTMSHEIRTPLNGLIGLNYLMSQKLDDPERLAGYLRQSNSTARYLLSLVSDILEMSQLQEHQIQLTHQSVDLEHLAATVSAIAQSGMEEKGIDFQTDIALGCPCVMGDDVRIQQVLLNLLDNARKFTSVGGQVTFRMEQSAMEDGAVLTRAIVADTGRGMSERFQKHIFESFSREMDTVSKGNEGTGLGLSISRNLAEMMGGTLTFTSEKGVGSRFVFTFPGEPADLYEPSDDDAPAAPAAPAHTPASILVAEDNELNGEIMLELLQDAGFYAQLAENGRIALDIFQNSEPGAISVILMDLLMPEMDGFQATAAIRALDRDDAKRVRIIACTANASEADRKKALSSGMNGFIAKPVNIDDLLHTLSSL